MSATATNAKMSEKRTGDLKKQVVEFKTMIYGNCPADPRLLGIHLLTKVIPAMDGTGDVAFAWGWAKNDVVVYNQSEYDTETGMYAKKHKMKKDDGDTEWHYEFKKGDKKRRAVITTEIWYKPNGNHNTSPIAILLGQFFGAGLHIAKVRFEDVE